MTKYFNPRSPCGERRAASAKTSSGLRYFNPRSPCGERHFYKRCVNRISNFNPRSPCGERPDTVDVYRISPVFQSTLPVWGATSEILLVTVLVTISIHAPRVGSDRGRVVHFSLEGDFNPRSPCGERPWLCQAPLVPALFQSTLPVWGATGTRYCNSVIDNNFNPRSPCGERPLHRRTDRNICRISIHAPRVGSDLRPSPSWQKPQIFQSTLPVWGATVWHAILKTYAFEISIHAPRVGSDLFPVPCGREGTYFNPRSPCGERPIMEHILSLSYDFNPRSPCGERPHSAARSNPPIPISIHAPRVGSDMASSMACLVYPLFQSTLPVWGATTTVLTVVKAIKISIHAPRVGSDHSHHLYHPFKIISIHAPRVGSDLLGESKINATNAFQSTLPVWGATSGSYKSWKASKISIHAPRVGSDQMLRRCYDTKQHISIHAPRVGSDAFVSAQEGRSGDFNPRSPCGERRQF